MSSANRIICLIGMVSFIIASISYADEGTATFYTKLRPSACDGNEGEGSLIGAASDKIWDDGSICGTMVKIWCTGPTNNDDGDDPCTGESVEVKIVDFCPHCHGTIDLSEAAFSKIANSDAGKIQIEYEYI